MAVKIPLLGTFDVESAKRRLGLLTGSRQPKTKADLSTQRVTRVATGLGATAGALVIPPVTAALGNAFLSRAASFGSKGVARQLATAAIPGALAAGELMNRGDDSSNDPLAQAAASQPKAVGQDQAASLRQQVLDGSATPTSLTPEYQAAFAAALDRARSSIQVDVQRQAQQLQADEDVANAAVSSLNPQLEQSYGAAESRMRGFADDLTKTAQATGFGQSTPESVQTTLNPFLQALQYQKTTDQNRIPGLKLAVQSDFSNRRTALQSQGSAAQREVDSQQADFAKQLALQSQQSDLAQQTAVAKTSAEALDAKTREKMLVAQQNAPRVSALRGKNLLPEQVNEVYTQPKKIKVRETWEKFITASKAQGTTDEEILGYVLSSKDAKYFPGTVSYVLSQFNIAPK